jgi:hypothetical protein
VEDSKGNRLPARGGEGGRWVREMGTNWRKDWVTVYPISAGNSIPAPHPPDFPPAQQLQQLLAEAGLAEVCVSACVCVWRGEGLWGQGCC